MRPILRILLALTALTISAAPAAAAPAVNGVFDLPGVTINGQLVQGPDGSIWVALEAGIGKVQPDGTTTVLSGSQLGNEVGSPTGGITVAGGAIWISQTPSGGKKAIVKIPPAAPATATGFDVTGVTAGATAMTTGADGNIWVGIADKLVRFSPTNPATSTPFTFTGLSPKGITSAGDGTLWVTDILNGGRLLNVTTAGVGTPYTVGGQPQFVGAGPNGQVAYGNPNSTPQQIGLLVPGGSPQLLNRPSGSDPFGVTFGADGAYWVAEFAGNRLARVTTDGQLTTLEGFPVVAGQGPRQITTGPGNTLWATLDKPGDPAATKIARITGVDPPVTNPDPTPVDQTPAGDQNPTTGPPPADTVAPVVAGVKLSKTRIRAGTRRITLRFTLSEPASLKLTLSRRRGTRFVPVRTAGAKGSVGQNALRISTRTLRTGRYRVALTATDAAGNRSLSVVRVFSVVR